LKEGAAILIFLLTLAIDIWTDYKFWKRNIPVDHTRGAILRLIGLVPVLFLLGWYSIPLVGFAYWILFDGIYNLARGFKWWFTGSDDKDDAMLDNLLQKLTERQQEILKIGGLLISIHIYVVALLW
jgi:hypothetical protein